MLTPELIRTIKETRPHLHVKGFTMIELNHMAEVADRPVEEVIEALKQAGRQFVETERNWATSVANYQGAYDRMLDKT